MARDWVLRCNLMEVKATTTLQLVYDFHDFRILQDLFNLWISVDNLHDWVILHLFLLFLSLIVSYLIKMISC
mgnify:CR=1 FL=1